MTESETNDEDEENHRWSSFVTGRDADCFFCGQGRLGTPAAIRERIIP